MNLHGKELDSEGFCEQPPRSVSDVFAQKNGSNILDSYADQRISINSTKRMLIQDAPVIRKSKIESSRGVGRKQKSWLRILRDSIGIRSAEHLSRLVENRQ
ncbi:hypothetical protein HUJ04_012373, partial [Dendroctonus ponderosae]